MNTPKNKDTLIARNGSKTKNKLSRKRRGSIVVCNQKNERNKSTKYPVQNNFKKRKKK
tara:strand:- start:44 stop:217 length:174 start_codon:yes stop_codon:yes gene_type:complete